MDVWQVIIAVVSSIELSEWILIVIAFVVHSGMQGILRRLTTIEAQLHDVVVSQGRPDDDEFIDE